MKIPFSGEAHGVNLHMLRQIHVILNKTQFMITESGTQSWLSARASVVQFWRRRLLPIMIIEYENLVAL